MVRNMNAKKGVGKNNPKTRGTPRGKNFKENGG
jgi:hypothetical protein